MQKHIKHKRHNDQDRERPRRTLSIQQKQKKDTRMKKWIEEMNLIEIYEDGKVVEDSIADLKEEIKKMEEEIKKMEEEIKKNGRRNLFRILKSMNLKLDHLYFDIEEINSILDANVECDKDFTRIIVDMSGIIDNSY